MPSQRHWIVPAIVGVFVFIVGLAIFFIVWAEADSIGKPTWARAIGPIVSFPLFSLAPKGFSTVYFWHIAVLNNLLWAVAVAALAWKSRDQ
jgi:hypothetical protein